MTETIITSWFYVEITTMKIVKENRAGFEISARILV